MGCDVRPWVLREYMKEPFSILERIEWAATYPGFRRVWVEQALSVSSNGSNGLRLAVFDRALLTGQPFSILERIEWAATVV